jgi:hypothetical protein
MDYSRRETWVFRPDHANKNVDVFYVYPTICSFKKNARRHNMNIYNPVWRLLARFFSSQHTAVFEDDCNVYAPFYRQVGLESLKMTVQEFHRYAHKAYLDVRMAFHHYMKYDNHGRPFILAGHSQGSIMLLELLKREFKTEELKGKLIAAYLIGFSVTDRDLAANPFLKIAQRADDVGVIITYNTGTTKYKKPLPIILPGAYCVNPLNWRTDSEYATNEEHLGAVFLKIGKKYYFQRPAYTGAFVNPQNHMLMIDEPMAIRLLRIAHIAGAKLAIHSFDYAIFFRNLKRNVKTRILAYMKKNR